MFNYPILNCIYCYKSSPNLGSTGTRSNKYFIFQKESQDRLKLKTSLHRGVWPGSERQEVRTGTGAGLGRPGTHISCPVPLSSESRQAGHTYAREDRLTVVYSPEHRGQVGTMLAGFQLGEEREGGRRRRERERERGVLFFEWKRLLSWF